MNVSRKFQYCQPGMQLLFEKLSGGPRLTDQCGVVCCHRNVNTLELTSLMSRDREDNCWQKHEDFCHNVTCQHDISWHGKTFSRDVSLNWNHIQVSDWWWVACLGPQPVNETGDVWLWLLLSTTVQFLSNKKYETWELQVFTSPLSSLPLSRWNIVFDLNWWLLL